MPELKVKVEEFNVDSASQAEYNQRFDDYYGCEQVEQANGISWLDWGDSVNKCCEEVEVRVN